MICPGCKALIPEGKLYCPSCGYAVQIVPDYDADLQENLDIVGSDIAGNVNRIDVAESNEVMYDADATTKEMPLVSKDKAADIRKQSEDTSDNMQTILTLAFAGIFLIAIVVVAVLIFKGLSGDPVTPQKAVESPEHIEIATVAPKEEEPPEDTAGAEEEAVSEDTAPAAPALTLTVTPESGSYSKPENIVASISDNNAEFSQDDATDGRFEAIIYYTDDGTEPNESSTIFKGELPMPVGKSRFAFRYLDSMGNLSETVYYDYELNYAGICKPADAVNFCIASLINAGALMDPLGHVAGDTGTYGYECTSMVKSGTRNYYMIPEHYTSAGGERRETGTIYAVDADALGLFRVKQNKDGAYVFEMFF